MDKAERSIGAKKKAWMIVSSVVPAMFVISAVMGSIFFGLATFPAAAASGAFANLLLALCYGRLNLKVMHKSMMTNLNITGMIMWTVVGAFVFTGAFMSVGGGPVVQKALTALPLGPAYFRTGGIRQLPLQCKIRRSVCYCYALGNRGECAIVDRQAGPPGPCSGIQVINGLTGYHGCL